MKPPKNITEDAPSSWTERHLSGLSAAYHTVLDYLKPILWNDSRNASTLAQMIIGIIKSKSSNMPEWVPFAKSKAKYAQSVERQFNRFLSNPHFDIIDIYGPLITRALKNWGNHRLVLALDTSMSFGEFCRVQISIVYRGRSVSLVWKTIKHSSAMVSSEEIIPLIAQAKGLLDFIGIKDVRLLADRGFVDINLMECLKSIGWHFRIRLKTNIVFSSAKKKKMCKLGEVALSIGEAKFYHNITITNKNFGPVHIACGRPTLIKETWLIVSDEPTSLDTFSEYGERFNIEEGFLDDKSNGFQLEDSKLRDAGKIDKLLLALAVTTLFLVCEGTLTVDQGLRRTVDCHWTRGLSYLKIGWRAIQHAWDHGKAGFSRFSLIGGPDPDPPKKSKSKQDLPMFFSVWTLAFRSSS